MGREEEEEGCWGWVEEGGVGKGVKGCYKGLGGRGSCNFLGGYRPAPTPGWRSLISLLPFPNSTTFFFLFYVLLKFLKCEPSPGDVFHYYGRFSLQEFIGKLFLRGFILVLSPSPSWNGFLRVSVTLGSLKRGPLDP